MVEAFFFFLSIKRVFPRFRREPTTNTERGKKKKGKEERIWRGTGHIDESSGRNDRVSATPLSRMVLWSGIGRFSRYGRKYSIARECGCSRSLTQIRADVHPRPSPDHPLWYSVFVQLRATRFQADVDRIKAHYENLIRYCDVPWTHFPLIIAAVLRPPFHRFIYYLFFFLSSFSTRISNPRSFRGGHSRTSIIILYFWHYI